MRVNLNTTIQERQISRNPKSASVATVIKNLPNSTAFIPCITFRGEIVPEEVLNYGPESPKGAKAGGVAVVVGDLSKYGWEVTPYYNGKVIKEFDTESAHAVPPVKVKGKTVTETYIPVYKYKATEVLKKTDPMGKLRPVFIMPDFLKDAQYDPEKVPADKVQWLEEVCKKEIDSPSGKETAVTYQVIEINPDAAKEYKQIKRTKRLYIFTKGTAAMKKAYEGMGYSYSSDACRLGGNNPYAINNKAFAEMLPVLRSKFGISTVLLHDAQTAYTIPYLSQKVNKGVPMYQDLRVGYVCHNPGSGYQIKASFSDMLLEYASKAQIERILKSPVYDEAKKYKYWENEFLSSFMPVLRDENNETSALKIAMVYRENGFLNYFGTVSPGAAYSYALGKGDTDGLKGNFKELYEKGLFQGILNGLNSDDTNPSKPIGLLYYNKEKLEKEMENARKNGKPFDVPDAIRNQFETFDPDLRVKAFNPECFDAFKKAQAEFEEKSKSVPASLKNLLEKYNTAKEAMTKKADYGTEEARKELTTLRTAFAQATQDLKEASEKEFLEAREAYDDARYELQQAQKASKTSVNTPTKPLSDLEEAVKVAEKRLEPARAFELARNDFENARNANFEPKRQLLGDVSRRVEILKTEILNSGLDGSKAFMDAEQDFIALARELILTNNPEEVKNLLKKAKSRVDSSLLALTDKAEGALKTAQNDYLNKVITLLNADDELINNSEMYKQLKQNLEDATSQLEIYDKALADAKFNYEKSEAKVISLSQELDEYSDVKTRAVKNLEVASDAKAKEEISNQIKILDEKIKTVNDALNKLNDNLLPSAKKTLDEAQIAFDNALKNQNLSFEQLADLWKQTENTAAKKAFATARETLDKANVTQTSLGKIKSANEKIDQLVQILGKWHAFSAQNANGEAREVLELARKDLLDFRDIVEVKQRNAANLFTRINLANGAEHPEYVMGKKISGARVWGDIDPKFIERINSGKGLVDLFVCWGRADEQKGLDIAIDSFATFVKEATKAYKTGKAATNIAENAVLVMGGPIGGSYLEDVIRNKVSTTLADSDLKGRFVFLDGFAPNGVLSSASTWALMPSRWAPCELVDHEARLALGMPIVSGIEGAINKNNSFDNPAEADIATGFKTKHNNLTSIEDINKEASYKKTMKTYEGAKKYVETEKSELSKQQTELTKQKDALLQKQSTNYVLSTAEKQKLQEINSTLESISKEIENKNKILELLEVRKSSNAKIAALEKKLSPAEYLQVKESLDSVEHQICNFATDNLTKEQKETLHKLKYNRDILLKKLTKANEVHDQISSLQLNLYSIKREIERRAGHIEIISERTQTLLDDYIQALKEFKQNIEDDLRRMVQKDKGKEFRLSEEEINKTLEAEIAKNLKIKNGKEAKLWPKRQAVVDSMSKDDFVRILNETTKLTQDQRNFLMINNGKMKMRWENNGELQQIWDHKKDKLITPRDKFGNPLSGKDLYYELCFNGDKVKRVGEVFDFSESAILKAENVFRAKLKKWGITFTPAPVEEKPVSLVYENGRRFTPQKGLTFAEKYMNKQTALIAGGAVVLAGLAYYMLKPDQKDTAKSENTKNNHFSSYIA